MQEKLILFMFFCYFVFLGGGVDDIIDLIVVLDLK